MPALDPESLPRHIDRLYRAAWALCGSPHEAEDLVQETFARVLARPRLLRGQDELAYLMTVLRNTFLTQRRTATRRPRVTSTAIEDLEPVDPRGGDRPEEALQAREAFAAIAGLPERYRLALVAVDIAGLSHREAANVLDTKEATIATRVFRARRFVVHALEGTGLQTGEPSVADADASGPPPAPGRSEHLGRPRSGDRHTEVLPQRTAGPSAPHSPDEPSAGRAEGEPSSRRLTQRSTTT